MAAAFPVPAPAPTPIMVPPPMGLGETGSAVSTEEIREEVRQATQEAVKEELPVVVRGSIDNWAIDQVDRPLATMKALYPAVTLEQPPLWSPTQIWAPVGFGVSLFFGILLIMAAYLNHARHMLKGTDTLRGRNPWTRLGVPGVCLILMLFAPVGWELLRAGQSWVWNADGFDRSDPDAVLAVVFPGSGGAEVPALSGQEGQTPEPFDDLGGKTPKSVPECTEKSSTLCHEPGDPVKIRYPKCGLFSGQPGVPCANPYGELEYPDCLAPAQPYSPCRDKLVPGGLLFGSAKDLRYPKCGDQLPGLPCSDPKDPYTAVREPLSKIMVKPERPPEGTIPKGTPECTARSSGLCQEPGDPPKLRYAKCGFFSRQAGMPCTNDSGRQEYPKCLEPASSHSPCRDEMMGKIRYPRCGDQFLGLPCSDPKDQYKAVKQPGKSVAPTPGTIPPGSVASIAASMGTAAGVGSGVAVIVVGLLSLVSYLVGRLLIMLAPLVFGWTAFSHRYEPTFVWVDLYVRTSLLTSLYNAAWALMRNLPAWMSWTGVDSVFFVVIVLPLLLVAIYLLWIRKVWAVVTDPLMQSGGDVMEKVGRRAGGLGRVVTVAGALIGQPAIAALGTKMSALGTATQTMGAQAKEQAAKGGTESWLKERIRTAADKVTDQQKSPTPAPTTGGSAPAAPQPAHGAPPSPSVGGTGGLAKCWRAGTQFVTVVKGTPTYHDSQPPGTEVVGDWDESG